MIHKHLWNDYEKKAFGYREKQEGQHNIILCEGHVKICRCGMIILVPDDTALRPVELERH